MIMSGGNAVMSTMTDDWTNMERGTTREGETPSSGAGKYIQGRQCWGCWRDVLSVEARAMTWGPG